MLGLRLQRSSRAGYFRASMSETEFFANRTAWIRFEVLDFSLLHPTASDMPMESGMLYEDDCQKTITSGSSKLCPLEQRVQRLGIRQSKS